MKKLRKRRKVSKKSLDRVSVKAVENRKQRGRRPLIPSNFVAGRAHNYNIVLTAYWPDIGKALLSSKTKEDAEAALQGVYESQRPPFMPVAYLIPEILGEKKFPKTEKAQIKFIAESLAGDGKISPRRARDICLQEKLKVHHVIIRQEYYIECSCGYRGPAKNGGCQKCGTTDVAINAGPPNGFL